MKTQPMLLASTFLFIVPLLADTVVDSPSAFEIARDAQSGKIVIAPSTVSAVGEPEGLPTPLFHFDATRTNDWTFNAARTQVTKIPSLVGDRYLASSLGDGDSAQLGNGSISAALWMPSVEALGGLPAIDLGAKNSTRGLFFDPIDNDGTIDITYTRVNVMTGMGTVVAVHRPLPDVVMPLFGGGFIKGSPWGASDTTCWKYNWKRDTSSGLREVYWQPVFYGYRGPLGGNWMYHDGVKTDPTASGFTGDWEISIFQPTEAKWQASGIGLAAIPSYAYERGGSQWAELYIFGEVVDEELLERLNVYLTAKWFGGRTTTGFNGLSSVGRVRVYRSDYTGNGATNAVSVAAGETLKIDRLSGGRGAGARLEKEGAGTLKVLDAAHFGGDIVMKGGTLDLSVRAVPDVAGLPERLSYRFDASDVEAMTLEEDQETGIEYIRRWANETTNIVKSGTAIYARAAGNNAAKRPWLVRNALGTGLHTIDFGKYNTANTTDDARYLDLTYSADGETFTTFTMPSVFTVVAVVGAQRSGGNILGGTGNNANIFARHQSNVDWMTDDGFTKPLLRTDVVKPSRANIYPITNSCVMIDGTVIDSQRGYDSPGFQVVALRVSAQGVKYIGGNGTRNGGLCISELLIWQRPLSETEIRDAEAYLTKKWFGRDLAGYRSAGHTLPEARTVVAEGESDIYVPAGQTVRVEGVKANAPLRKTGGGTLEVGPFGGTGESSLTVVDGAVKPVAALDVVTDASAPAQGASLHLDAADEKSFYMKPGTETGEVWCWYDKMHRNAAYMMASGRNPVRLLSGATLNGVPVVDCQPDDTKRGLYFARGLDGIRAAFVVWQPLEGGPILGSQSARDANSTAIDFMRHSNGKGLIIYNQGAYPVRNGKIYTNGVLVAVAATSLQPPETFQLTELYPASAAHASALGYDRGSVCGKARFAEIILYERELSEREKVATRNYLMAKWFQGSTLQTLPDAEPAVLPGSLAYNAGATFHVDIDSEGRNDILAVSGTLAFGAGTSIEVTGLSNTQNPRKARITLANAAQYTGLANLENATIRVDGVEVAGNGRPLFKVTSAGDLVMRFGGRRFTLTFR